MPKIVFTGGGTAGHVTPNIAIIEVLRLEKWDMAYIGSKDGVEREMISALSIPYYAVASGKLRRYFSWQNFLDPYFIGLGIIQSYFLMRKLKPDVVFSKGGFVAFPVVVGAWLNRIPVIAHESDMTPGLANRLSFPFVRSICLTFEAAKKHFNEPEKVRVTGTPIRAGLFQGDKAKGLALCHFTADKPCLLVIGGSQGASALNRCIRQLLDTLVGSFQIIHLCGKGKVDDSLLNRPGYYQSEYAQDELADLFAASDMVISRSGANSLSEILALAKPHVLIPLSEQVSRGDQVHNARYFQEQGISLVIDEDRLTPDTLHLAIEDVLANHNELTRKMNALGVGSATATIVNVIKETIHA